MRQVAVEVGAGQNHDERLVWMPLAECGDGFVAAVRMQGEQQIAALAGPLVAHGDAVAGIAQESGPAPGSVAIAVAGAGSGGRDDRDASHGAGLDLSVMLAEPRVTDPAMLQRDLLDARARALRATAGLEGERLFGPRLAIVNPPLWEIGHVAWFQERWCRRRCA